MVQCQSNAFLSKPCLANLKLRCYSLDSRPEGEIIRSSSGIKFGAGSITHAGGGSAVGHSTAAGGTGRLDAQPLTPSVNVSTKTVILNLCISHSSISGPLGTRISFVDFRYHCVALLQDLSRYTLSIGYLLGLVAVPLGQLAIMECSEDEPGGTATQQRHCGVAPPASQNARALCHIT